MEHNSKGIGRTHVQGSVDVSGICQDPCPYLGSRRDRATPMGFPHVQNRCYRHGEELDRELQYQRLFCLSDQFEKCEIFREADKPLTQEDSFAKQRTGRRLAVPVGLIIILLLILVGLPIVMMDAAGENSSRLLPFLDPVYALFQPAPAGGEESGIPPATEDAGKSGDSAFEAESIQGPGQKDGQSEGPMQNSGSIGSGNFRTVPYE